jgi:hypothetical protein
MDRQMDRNLICKQPLVFRLLHPGWALGRRCWYCWRGFLEHFPAWKSAQQLGVSRFLSQSDIANLLHVSAEVCYMIAGFATLTILMKNSLMENLELAKTLPLRDGG